MNFYVYVIGSNKKTKITYVGWTININKRILSFRTEVGKVLSLSSSDVPDGNKFTLGGRSLRGFDIKGVGPRNSSSSEILDNVSGCIVRCLVSKFTKPLSKALVGVSFNK